MEVEKVTQAANRFLSHRGSIMSRLYQKLMEREPLAVHLLCGLAIIARRKMPKYQAFGQWACQANGPTWPDLSDVTDCFAMERRLALNVVTVSVVFSSFLPTLTCAFPRHHSGCSLDVVCLERDCEERAWGGRCQNEGQWMCDDDPYTFKWHLALPTC